MHGDRQMGQMKLNKEQKTFALHCFCEWASLASNYDEPGRHVTAADIDHSALLERLLDGEKAFEYPPPKFNSYPYYDAALDKKFQIGKPMEFDDDDDSEYHGKLLIDGHTIWEWYDKDNKVVTHIVSGRQFQLTVEDDDQYWMQLIGKPFPYMYDDDPGIED